MSVPLLSRITDEDVAALSVTERLSLDDKALIEILQALESVDVQACPGSGKTTLIAAKLILLATKWNSMEQGVCVLSHTNVAKDEIIKCLERSSTLAARSLLSYPHFIGTIQEFVNRYIALPYLRSRGVTDITVENDEYVRVARKILGRREFSWLNGTLNGLGGEDNKDAFIRTTFRLISPDGISINISKRPGAWRTEQGFSTAKRDLSRLKGYLDKAGVFLFRDMYTQAYLALLTCEELPAFLRVRFPILFLDEMQDTQKFQDELLQRIFPINSPDSVVQRFGDPDQAIFHGIGGDEEPNVSFNGKAAADMDFVLHKSRRFSGEISELARPFSFNAIPLETALGENALTARKELSSTGEAFRHSVIVFNDASVGGVVPKFSEIVSEQFSADYISSPDFAVKVVGAVGNEIDPNEEQLKIGHYWGGYSKDSTKKSFKAETLLGAVRFCRRQESPDWGERYQLIIDSVLRLMILSDKADDDGRRFSTRSLRSHLEDRAEWTNFRECIYLMLDPVYEIDEEFWSGISEVLCKILDLDPAPQAAADYLAYTEDRRVGDHQTEEIEGSRGDLQMHSGNILKHKDGFSVELSTIHGVKGQTHDATLVLETRSYCYDMEAMLPYFVGQLPSEEQPNHKLPEAPHATRKFKPNKRFMRQLYVAMSRPRHLLCLAVHSDRFRDHEKDMQEKGWEIVRL